MKLRRIILGVLVGSALLCAASAPDDDAVRVIVIDPGHGGSDYGARGPSGFLEKDLVLQVSRRIGAALEKSGFKVVYTRKADRFVSLAERTEIANRAAGDLYLSIHANSADDRDARGTETYFLSLDASDEEARRVAMTENRVFEQDGTAPASGDVVGGILGDLIRTEHLRRSSQIASAVQRELSQLPGPQRGVKQAPFVVLMGVNMPAALVEIGFLTNAEEEGRLRASGYQRRIAAAIAAGVKNFRATRDLTSSEEGGR